MKALLILCALVRFTPIQRGVLFQTGREDTVIRFTNHGLVRGHTTPFNQEPTKMLDVFVGIPYSAPMIGDLRWEAPQDPDNWEGIRDAMKFSSACPQPLHWIRRYSFGPDWNDTSEDCLYLNVYAPRNLLDLEEVFPVMVWIHGGAFRYGSGEEYDGRFLAQEGVVVVTVNYRLGFLGFLSTDEETTSGNYGLLDQIKALRWVKDNIQYFGGDPNLVTIFGNSAGGGSVGHLMFSPLTEGLFMNAVTQSGTALSPWSMFRPPLKHRAMAEQLAEGVNCTTETNEAMMSCLREAEIEDLLNTRVVLENGFSAAFVPRIDGHVILDLPETRLAEGSFHRVNLMSGTVSHEVAHTYENEPDFGEGISREDKETRMRTWSERYGPRFGPMVGDSIIQKYDHPGDDREANRDDLMKMRTDNMYKGPHNAHVLGHSSEVLNTYLYSFEHRAENHDKPDWMGVPHGEEFYYIFGTPYFRNWECPWGCRNVVWFNRFNYTEEDRLLSDDLMRMWANFAKYGEPLAPRVEWPRFNESHQSHLIIRGDEWRVERYHEYHRCKFWHDFIPTLQRRVENITSPMLPNQ